MDRTPRDPPLPPYPNAKPSSEAVQPPTPPAPQPTPILNPPVPITGAALLVGTPVDNVFPRRADPGTPPVDGRTEALKSLGSYLTSLAYARAGQVGGNPVFFAIPEQNFFVDRPGPETDLPFPSVVCLGGTNTTIRGRGLIPVVNPSTVDLFGAGTVLVTHGEHEEEVSLEVWSSTLPELRSLIAQMTQAFAPTQERNGFLLLMPDYYSQTARFMLERVEWPDDAGAVKNRRFARLVVFMAYDVVRLVNYVQTLVQGQLDTENPPNANSLVVAPDPTIGGGVPIPLGPRS